MEPIWLKQYAEGMDHEIYRIKLSEKMENKTFAEVSGLVYKHSKSIVFGIQITTNGKTIIRLNPSDFIIPNIIVNEIWVYAIQSSLKKAEEIETLDMTVEEVNKYLNAKAAADKKTKEMEQEGEISDEDGYEITDRLDSAASNSLNTGVDDEGDSAF